MIIDIITIFPEMFNDFLSTSIVKRAQEDGKVVINLHQLRDYSHNKHRNIDDTPYGGGTGMLMTFPPFYDVITKLRKDHSKVIYLSPQGKILDQQIAFNLAECEHLILLCGHYEGIDERVLNLVDYEISIGDYILTGGELAVMVLVDVITRLIPGVITEESVTEDSLTDGLLKYPQYTKPRTYKGFGVPDILLSGHHEEIEKWRKRESLKQTLLKRPDLLEKKTLTDAELEIIKSIKDR
ncbi:MAG: tRNA (guanosine(37)-N1)-methyltransferase TrmD [Acholeplasmataceae bacterium]|jgi:tRNA (guanine37-N1)-methyltransferase